MRHYFFYVSTDVKWNVQLLLFFAGDNVYFPSLYLYKENFPYEGGDSIVYPIFKTSVRQRKDHLALL